MTDHPRQHAEWGPGGRPGMARINIDDPENVRAWCKTFNCSPVDLIEAVAVMGPVAEDVHAFLSHRLAQVPDFIDPAVFRSKAGAAE